MVGSDKMGCNSCNKIVEVLDVRLLVYLAKTHIFKSLALHMQVKIIDRHINMLANIKKCIPVALNY